MATPKGKSKNAPKAKTKAKPPRVGLQRTNNVTCLGHAKKAFRIHKIDGEDALLYDLNGNVHGWEPLRKLKKAKKVVCLKQFIVLE